MSDFPFTGRISDTGEHPRLADYIKAIKYFCLCRKGKLVDLHAPKKVSQQRTNLQNRYMWGLYGLLSDYTGFTTQEIHDMMRGLFLFKMVVIGETEIKVLISTTTLTTMEEAEYIEKFREWQREHLPECYLPTPDEWKRWEEGEIVGYLNKEATA